MVEVLKVIGPFVAAVLAFAGAWVAARHKRAESLDAFTETQLRLLIEQYQLELGRLRKENARLETENFGHRSGRFQPPAGGLPPSTTSPQA
jgi:hypothetical protein